MTKTYIPDGFRPLTPDEELKEGDFYLPSRGSAVPVGVGRLFVAQYQGCKLSSFSPGYNGTFLRLLTAGEFSPTALGHRDSLGNKREWTCTCRNLKNYIGDNCYWCGKEGP